MYTTEGGTVEIEGVELLIEPDENRIHGALWKNGAMIEVMFYGEPVVGLDDSDRIRVRITDANKQITSLRLNVDDALEMVEGLSKGIKLCLENGVPYTSVN
ncbi:hypothetical protein BH09PAT1_BH09PAT1_2760 [soil metagenome]